MLFSFIGKKDSGGGGGGATLIEKSVTSNGVYNASSDSADGYSKVNVAVPDTKPSNATKTLYVVYVTKQDGTKVSGATVTFTDTSLNDYTATTDSNGRAQKELAVGNYTISVGSISGYTTPNAQTVQGDANETNYVSMNYIPSSVTYGVKIDLTDSNPETSVTYTDDAVGFSKSYMDFANDAFVWGSWQNKWPFNQVKPCLFKNGAVVKYLNPDNYAQDTDGNPVDITGPDGDVMIEIPKIYYKLSKDANYQYIQISDTAQTGFCCLAHTYKGVEKNKVYIGAYQAYNESGKARSISGVSATGSVSMNSWRTYAQANGTGYEQFYWHLLVLLQCLYVIQFKNLDSQSALGYGWCNQSGYSTGGGLNAKGMYYGTATSGQMKFLGIEDFYGSRRTWIDGTYTSGTKLTIADVTSASMSYNGSGTSYIEAGDSGLSGASGYTKSIVGSNLAGFTPTNVSGSATTYYCDYSYFGSGSVLLFGGHRSITTNAGAFFLYFYYNATNTYASIGGRLAFCG